LLKSYSIQFQYKDLLNQTMPGKKPPQNQGKLGVAAQPKPAAKQPAKPASAAPSAKPLSRPLAQAVEDGARKEAPTPSSPSVKRDTRCQICSKVPEAHPCHQDATKFEDDEDHPGYCVKCLIGKELHAPHVCTVHTWGLEAKDVLAAKKTLNARNPNNAALYPLEEKAESKVVEAPKGEEETEEELARKAKSAASRQAAIEKASPIVVKNPMEPRPVVSAAYGPTGDIKLNVLKKLDGECYGCVSRLRVIAGLCRGSGGAHVEGDVVVADVRDLTYQVTLNITAKGAVNTATPGLPVLSDKSAEVGMGDSAPNDAAYHEARREIFSQREKAMSRGKLPTSFLLEKTQRTLLYRANIAHAREINENLDGLYLCGCKAVERAPFALKDQLEAVASVIQQNDNPFCCLPRDAAGPLNDHPVAPKAEILPHYEEEYQRKAYYNVGIDLKSPLYQLTNFLFYSIIIGMFGRWANDATAASVTAFKTKFPSWHTWSGVEELKKGVSEKPQRPYRISTLPNVEKLKEVGALVDDGNETVARSWFQKGYEFALDGHDFVKKVIEGSITGTNYAFSVESPQEIVKSILKISPPKASAFSKTIYEELDRVCRMIKREGKEKTLVQVKKEELESRAKRVNTLLEKPYGNLIWKSIKTFFNLFDHGAVAIASDIDSCIGCGSVSKAIQKANGLGLDQDLDTIHSSHFELNIAAKTLRLRGYAVTHLKVAVSWSAAISELANAWTAEEMDGFSGKDKASVIETGAGEGKGDTPKVQPKAPAMGNKPKRVAERAAGVKRSARTPANPDNFFWCSHCGSKFHTLKDRNGLYCGEDACSAKERKAVLEHNRALFELKGTKQKPKDIGEQSAPKPPREGGAADAPTSPRPSKDGQKASADSDAALVAKILAILRAERGGASGSN
jgi:hypothetical protein